MSRTPSLLPRGRCRALLLAILALPISVSASLPVPPEDVPVLRIQGSNTIGAQLGPALVQGLFEQAGLQQIRLEPGTLENEQRVLARTPGGRQVVAQIAAHGSGTGFSALLDGSADLAAASRPIKDAEAHRLQALGNMRSPAAEQVIAIDGLAVILHPDNPLDTLSVTQVARLFAGEISDWAVLGGRPGAVHLYARDDNSGTYDTFSELVLAPRGRKLSLQTQRFESSDRLSEAVSSDPQGIGFIGLPYVRQAKAVAIVSGDSLPMQPSSSLIATEDYPLSRRLFFYAPEQSDSPWVHALIDFTQGPQGQAIVERNGFIAQTVRPIQVPVETDMPPRYRQLAGQAQRLSVNFRFQEGSANLDNKARRDLQRVASYLKRQSTQRQIILVGFGDLKNDPQRAELLSRLRAMAVRRELARHDLHPQEIIGLGDELPVATNSETQGRQRNRRVEVWVR
ncbi:substrate-binding domain-containing protein [Pseudomonas sp. NCCP-436]|uniref:substrate-binding domain-containing protein n=1 Tax=Pseudomonas sp. NCCP-436 TaxID=2842481 RepID=UPI001C81885E|nr:phosphate ABC transporter substrate-binding/OmpA family protein [Pseudomonas sp. NCCP-436]GIZ11899.1 membrane protein [Pseudomonas sp. NCCP-436]